MQYPSDAIALVVLWRRRYKLSLRDLAEMFLTRGVVFSYEAVRDWEAKPRPALADEILRSSPFGMTGPGPRIRTTPYGNQVCCAHPVVPRRFCPR